MKIHVRLAVFGLLLIASCSGQTSDDPDLALEVESFPEQMVGVHLSESAVQDILNGQIEPPEYNSDPPTSGPHAAQAAACGIFRQAVPDVYQLHNLAIGVIVVQYSPALEAVEVERLERLARDSFEQQFIVAPRAGLPAPVVATAWTKMMQLDAVAEDSLRVFYDQYVGKGPDSGECPFGVDEGI